MKNFNNTNKNQEQVEVMALFGYEMTPCQPLSFRRRGEREGTNVSELLSTKIRFVGNTAMHIFDVVAGRENYRLEFNSASLAWTVAKQ